MPVIHDAAKNSLIYPFLNFKERTLRRSKVDFRAYEVTADENIFAQNDTVNMVSYLNKDVSILVSDLSGFTKTTKEWGITHMASIIIRMR